MRAILFIAAIGFSLPHTCTAALMGPGDIAFIGLNTDGNDDFSFVTLVDIEPATAVFFSERTWSGSSFSGAEWTVKWFSGASTIAAGTVVSFTNLKDSSQAVSHGQFASFSGSLDLSNSNEALWAYLGPNLDSPTAFLSVVANDLVGASGFTTLSGTGLIDGVNSQIIAADIDIMSYVGPRSGLSSFSEYRSLISNDANWITQDGNFNQSTDGTAPDVPFNSTAFAVSSASVPEPSALMLAISGLLTIAVSKRRRRAG